MMVFLKILGINIYPGQKIDIRIQMEDRIVSDAFLELPLETRKCRIDDENFDPDSIFVCLLYTSDAADE